jgi:Lytic transglycolase
MSPRLVQRQAALAAVALVAGLVTIAFTDERAAPLSGAGGPLPAGGGGWQDAVAGVYRPDRSTSCGIRLDPQTIGIAHPVLPCGAKVVVLYDGRQVETEVVDKDLRVGGRDFDLTAALAAQLGFDGTRRLRWRFAGE